jgi:nicotinate phosphoribosyltransferase
MNALLTDLYELTMAAGYHDSGKAQQKATFELSIRRLPQHRNFVLSAGLPQVVDYLQNLRFTEPEIAYLQSLPQFANVSQAFFDYLRDFRFTGDLFAVPEGTPLFAGEPIAIVRAPIIEAQIPETYLLSAFTFPTLIASKAARCADAAAGRPVVEFGTRRAHTPEAGTIGARAAYLGGCAGTSNTLAGLTYHIPVMGTAAHSWIMSFACEEGAFKKLRNVLGPATVQLIDTYDPIQGARNAVKAGGPIWGVRLDSGDFDTLSRQVRAILDEGGMHDARIMVSGDLDEYRIRDLVAAGAPIDSFGVGTQLATSADAPHMSAIYKVVEVEICGIKRYAAKYSTDKGSLPGAKQIFREKARDILARSGECGNGEALLRPILIGGRLIEPLPTLEQARQRAAESIALLPPELRALEPAAEPWPVIHSRELRELTEQTRANMPR